MTARNLEPGQYQIGDFVFGEGTLFNVEGFDIGAYDVNVQDFQLPGEDEMRFGSDTLKPMPIQITINARKNFVLPNIAGLTQSQLAGELNFDNDPRPGQFAKEWRADDIRGKWGELKPLLICREVDGRVVRVYGRPGKLAVPPFGRKAQNQKIIAEYRRSDTLCYSDFEWYAQVRPGEEVIITRAEDFDMGNAPSWLRFLIIGPMKHPIIQLGSAIIELDIELALGEVVEVSSYPWQRRVIRVNDNISLNARLLRPYLNKLKFDADSGISLSWTATDVNVITSDVQIGAYSDGPLPSSEWLTFGDGDVKVVDGELKWIDHGNSVQTFTAIKKEPTSMNYQYVEMELSSPMESSLIEEECSNRIIGQSNDDGTEYTYWDITYTQVWYGYHKDGVDHPITKPKLLNKLLTVLRNIWGDLSQFDFSDIFEPQDNWVYGAEFGSGAGELGSTLRINGVIVDTYDGVGSPVNFVDNQHLYTGIGMRATQRLLGQSTPGPIARMVIRDNQPPGMATAINNSMIYILWRDAWQTI